MNRKYLVALVSASLTLSASYALAAAPDASPDAGMIDPGMPVLVTPPACLPLESGILSFRVSGAHVGAPGSGDALVTAGQIPEGDSNAKAGAYGSVTLGVSAPSDTRALDEIFEGKRVDESSVQLSLVTATEANQARDGVGQIRLSLYMQQQLRSRGKCLTGLSLSLQHGVLGNAHLLYLGSVYFYFEGGQGFSLNF